MCRIIAIAVKFVAYFLLVISFSSDASSSIFEEKYHCSDGAESRARFLGNKKWINYLSELGFDVFIYAVLTPHDTYLSGELLTNLTGKLVPSPTSQNVS